MAGFAFDPKRYPTAPGCYLMKNAAGQVIYVGKAKSLRHRLASYFQPRHKHPRVERMVERIADIEVILVNNEVESLILENNLIKRYKPRFNRMLVREDSGYPYIVLTGEKPPRFLPYHKSRVNKQLERARGQAERRFGPYLGRRFRDALLEYVTESFQTRICRDLPRRVCLRYHLRRCSGICEDKISPEDYAAAVERAVAFLAQPHADLIRQMKGRMLEHAERLEFEQAQRVRDQLQVLESALERQVVERDVGYDQDVIYLGEGQALVAEVKRGALWSLCLLPFESAADDEAGKRFLIARYARNSPSELIVNRLRDPGRVEAALATTNGYTVRITLPEKGVAHELVRLCELNYAYRTKPI